MQSSVGEEKCKMLGKRVGVERCLGEKCWGRVV